MSRVSRLSEIRKRRAAGSGKEEAGNLEDSVDGNGVKQNEKVTDAKVNDEKVNDESVEKNSVSQTQEVFGVKPQKEVGSADSYNDVESAVEHIPNALNAEDQERLYRDIYNQTGLFEAEETQPAKAISYNSDLKDDLAPLYNRARHGTERAINAVIQRKYHESLGHNE